MKFEIAKNEKFGSLEITFGEKPAAAIRDALKARRFRWNGARGIWYGFTEETPEQLAAALEAAETGTAAPVAAAMNRTGQNTRRAARPALAPLWDRCSVSDLPGYGTENAMNSAARKAAHDNGSRYDKEAAKIIRAELKKRFPEMKISVTSGGAGWLENVDIRIKSGPYPMVEKDINICGRTERRTVPGDALQAVLDFCDKLHDAFDADDGDHYADYGAHHDLYGSACVAWGYEQTEPTDAQRADLAAFAASKAEHEAAEEARRAAEWEQQERERAAEAERARIQAEQDARTVAEIENAVTVEDIPEAQQRIYSGLVGGYGKPCSLDDLNRQIKILAEEGRAKEEKARVSRVVRFPSEELYSAFCGLFDEYYSFLANMGGSGTDDPRVTAENFGKLNAEQRAAVEWILVNCVAVCVGDDLKLIIDPQGFSYARYVYLVPEDAQQNSEPAEEYRQRIEAAAGEDFYMPAPMAEQIRNLEPGEAVTVLSVDGMTMAARLERGTLEAAKAEPYAQHADAAKLTIRTGRKTKEQHVYNGGAGETVVYCGLLPDLPREMLYTTERVGAGAVMERVNFCGAGVRDFIKSAIRYYASLGYTPAVDNVQR